MADRYISFEIDKPEGLAPMLLPADWLVGKHAISDGSSVVAWVADATLAAQIVELLNPPPAAASKPAVDSVKGDSDRFRKLLRQTKYRNDWLGRRSYHILFVRSIWEEKAVDAELVLRQGQPVVQIAPSDKFSREELIMLEDLVSQVNAELSKQTYPPTWTWSDYYRICADVNVLVAIAAGIDKFSGIIQPVVSPQIEALLSWPPAEFKR